MPSVIRICGMLGLSVMSIELLREIHI